MKHFIIASLFLSAALAGCSSKNGGANSSSGNASSTVTFHSSNMVSGTTYSGQAGYDAAVSYSCAGGVSGNTTLSTGSFSVGSASLSSCTITFNSVTYNGSTNTCDTSTTVSSANPAYQIPVLITCSSYTLKIVTSGIFNTTTSTSKSIYATLISSTDFSLIPPGTSSQQTVLPVVGAGDQFTCALVHPDMLAANPAEIFCWGYNPNLAFFSPPPSTTTSIAYAVPTQIPTTTSTSTTFTPATLAVGDNILCSMDTSNNVWCMGTTAPTLPAAFIPITGIIGTPQKIAVGSQSGCVLTAEDSKSLQCWGYVDFNTPAASGGFASIGSPVTIGGFSGAISQFVISNDPSYGAYGALCAIIEGATTAQNTVECTGNELYGQLGRGVASDSDYHTPASVVLSDGTTPLTGVVQLSGNYGTFCAVTTTTAVYCWGAANNTPETTFLVLNSYSGGSTVGDPFLCNAPSVPSSYDPNTSTCLNLLTPLSMYGTDYQPLQVREPNFFGFMSYDSWSASGWPGGGYVSANVPTGLRDFTSTQAGPYAFLTSLNYATLMTPLTLNTIFVGRQTICGTYNSKSYCYGADLTIEPPTTQAPSPAQRQTDSLPPGFNNGYPIMNMVSYFLFGGIWFQYAYGDLGTLTLSQSLTPGGASNDVNGQVISYTADKSATGGGIFTFTSTPVAMSVGMVNPYGCANFGWVSYIGPGQACVVTIDGAISCFGTTDCGQVGNNTTYSDPTFAAPPAVVTSPVPVLFPSSLSGTYSSINPSGVTY